MRITGGRLVELQADAITSSQSRVGELARELSSGLRVETPSQDPTAWLAARRADLKRELSAGTGVAIRYGRDRLDETERALTSIQDAVSEARSLAVQGANGTYTAEGRAQLALQVRSLFDAARAAANTRMPDGEYLLAGSNSLVEPFDATGAYLGDGVTRSLATSDNAYTVATVSGEELTAAQGVDVLPLLASIATALDANDVPTLTGLLGDLNTAIGQLSAARGRGGAAMSALDEATLAHEQLELNLSDQVAGYVESDTISAASELARAGQALDASRAVAERIIALVDRVTSR